MMRRWAWRMEVSWQVILVASLCFTDVIGSCLYEGKSYQKGETFPAVDGCNNCQCRKGGMVLCSEEPCPKQPKTCTYEGKMFKEGEIYTDGSIQCVCSGGEGMRCQPTSRICEYDGSQYLAGDSFEAFDGCNRCTCDHDVGVVCTDMTCSGRCFYDSKAYSSGEIFTALDGCNTCQCLDTGEVSCTEQFCEGACIFKEQAYAKGAVFPALDGCNECHCEDNGQVSCTELACDRVCSYDGVIYQRGDKFTSMDGCNTCMCNDIGVVCSSTDCDSAELKEESKDDAPSVPLEGCGYYGIVIPHEATVNCVDGCNLCTCTSTGLLLETDKACDRDLHYSCVYGNLMYHAGDRFPSKDGCNNCFCTADGVTCTERGCPSLLNVQECVYNGHSYKQGQEVKNMGSDCEGCICDASGFPMCSLKGCIPKEATQPRDIPKPARGHPSPYEEKANTKEQDNVPTDDDSVQAVAASDNDAKQSGVKQNANIASRTGTSGHIFLAMIVFTLFYTLLAYSIP